MSGARAWKNPPPVVVVSGEQEWLREREVRRAIDAASAANRRVVRVAAGDSIGLRELLSGGFLFSEATLAVVDSAVVKKRATKGKKAKVSDETTSDVWSEEDFEMVLEHGKGTSSDVSLVVHHVGEATATTFAGKLAAALPKGRHAVYVAPKPWEARDYATKFLMQEVRRLGKSIEEPLAEAVVRQAGVELGSLAFEALKVSTLLDIDSRTEVRQEDLRGLIAAVGGEDWQTLKEAVAGRNVKVVVRALGEIRGGPGGDSPMGACMILGQAASRWLHAAALREAGVGEEEAAGRVGMHPFPYKKDVLPTATRWGRARLANLLRSIAAVENGVKRGHSNPWVALESSLILACLDRG